MLMASPAVADCLDAPETVRIAEVRSATTLLLTDGRSVRLADIVAEDAAALGEIAQFRGREALFSKVAKGEPDRHGRLHGDVAIKDTRESIRARLVERGLALVDPAVMSAPCLAELFDAERTAEADGRGRWAKAGSVIAAAERDLAAERGRYVIVDGTVTSVGETRRTIYLNFGVDWRTDFTALIRRSDARDFAGDVPALAGRRVRIRGVLEAWNGGLIRVEHLAQIERLEGIAASR